MLNLLVRLVNSGLGLRQTDHKTSSHHIRQLMIVSLKRNSVIFGTTKRKIPRHIRHTRHKMTVTRQVHSSTRYRRIMSLKRFLTLTLRLLMSKPVILKATISLRIFRTGTIRLINRHLSNLNRVTLASLTQLHRRTYSTLMNVKLRMRRKRILRLPFGKTRTRAINRKHVRIRNLTDLGRTAILARNYGNTRIIRAINGLGSSSTSILKRNRRRLSRHRHLFLIRAISFSINRLNRTVSRLNRHVTGRTKGVNGQNLNVLSNVIRRHNTRRVTIRLRVNRGSNRLSKVISMRLAQTTLLITILLNDGTVNLLRLEGIILVRVFRTRTLRFIMTIHRGLKQRLVNVLVILRLQRQLRNKVVNNANYNVRQNPLPLNPQCSQTIGFN